MNRLLSKILVSILLILSSYSSGFSQIENVYSALLLKPGHVYLSSDQMKLNLEKPTAVKSISLEKNTQYAFSCWSKEAHRDFINMELRGGSDSLMACLNPGYETSKSVRYFYFTPKESGLYNIIAEWRNDTLSENVYLIQGVFFTDPESTVKITDKKYSSPYCE